MKRSIKLLLGTSANIVLALTASGACAANYSSDWYAGISGDLTWLRHSDTGGGGNVDLGYRFWPSNFGDFRIEGEAGYHGAGGDSGFSSTHYFTYMGNLYYDFNSVFPSSASGWHVAPYVGGGIGDAEVHLGNGGVSTTFHHHSNDFAYDGMAGLSFNLSSMPRTDWLIGYRYLGTDSNNIHANNLELGLRFHF